MQECFVKHKRNTDSFKYILCGKTIKTVLSVKYPLQALLATLPQCTLQLVQISWEEKDQKIHSYILSFQLENESRDGN